MFTPLLETVSIFLLISYDSFGSWLNPAIFDTVIWLKLLLTLATVPLPAITCSPLLRISNESPTFKFDSSIDVLSENVEPDI